MTDAPVTDLGAPPAELQFGVVESEKGRVVIRLSHLVQWFDMDPETALDFASAITECAGKIASQRAIIPARRVPKLPGIPS